MDTITGLPDMMYIKDEFSILDSDNTWKTVPTTLKNILDILNGESPYLKRKSLLPEEKRHLQDVVYVLIGRQKERDRQNNTEEGKDDRI